MDENYGHTEKEIITISSYHNNCIGCKRHNKDVMISYTSKQDGKDIIDLFLTNEQAVYLYERLSMCINDNL